MTEPLHVSALLLYELRQSVRFQIWWHSQNPRKGIRTTKGEEALADLEANLASGAVVIVSADWADVHRTAERLSASYTKAEGHRALDILHVATALHLNTREFLTFDAKQRKLATAEPSSGGRTSRASYWTGRPRARKAALWIAGEIE